MGARKKAITRRKIDLNTFIDDSGVRVCQCCASCKYKRYNSETTRLCMLGYGIVSPKDPPCKDYEYNDIFSSPKVIGQGKIKRMSYFRYYEENYELVLNRLKEDYVKSGYIGKTPSCLEIINVIRSEYESKFGFSYYTDI